MYRFHASLHALPREAQQATPLELSGRRVQAIAVTPEMHRDSTLACTFEEASSALSRLPRMFCEPDGSFVWTSGHGEPAWQVDGNLYDRDGRLLFVDLKGTCLPQPFDDLLRAFGWPTTPLMFQLTRQAVFVDEDEFRRLASSDDPSPA